jgi:hypothetical protein
MIAASVQTQKVGLAPEFAVKMFISQPFAACHGMRDAFVSNPSATVIGAEFRAALSGAALSIFRSGRALVSYSIHSHGGACLRIVEILEQEARTIAQATESIHRKTWNRTLRLTGQNLTITGAPEKLRALRSGLRDEPPERRRNQYE